MLPCIHNSALDEGECSASRIGRFNPSEIVRYQVGIHKIFVDMVTILLYATLYRLAPMVLCHHKTEN
jgi:hypothetical protein